MSGEGMMLLRQDVAHRRVILDNEARIARREGMLRLAARVLRDGDEAERADVARQIGEMIGEVEA